MANKQELLAALILERARVNYLIERAVDDPDFWAWNIFGDGEIRGASQCDMADSLHEAATEILSEVA